MSWCSLPSPGCLRELHAPPLKPKKDEKQLHVSDMSPSEVVKNIQSQVMTGRVFDAVSLVSEEAPLLFRFVSWISLLIKSPILSEGGTRP